MDIKTIKYTTFFCEENIWYLCQNDEFSNSQKFVLFISNNVKKCPFWYQKAGQTHQPIWWDYHVILAVKLDFWYIYDLDTTLAFPLELHIYLSKTFQQNSNLSSQYFPQFKIIDSDEYRNDFHSDRKHMRDSNGNWLASPPAWPLIENSKKLSIKELLNFSSTSNHRIFSRMETIDYFKTKHIT